MHAQHLSSSAIRQSLIAIGLAIALQFPFALYQGGLLGLQRQVELNVLTAILATVRGVGAIAILAFISPTIQAYFIWQVVVYGLQTIFSAILLWRSLPRHATRPRFQGQTLLRVLRFAGGVSGITVLGVVLSQMDKVVLTRQLSLTEFGYYSVASVIATGLYTLTGPVYSAVFPRLSQLVALDDEARLTKLYHQACQLMSVVVFSIATVIAVFAPEVLKVWTRNPTIVTHAHLVVTLLIIGTALNCLMSIPYNLMLAYGWTKVALVENIVAVLVLVPMLVIAVNHFGAPGAASMWLLLNVGYVVVGIQIMHTRLLKGQRLRWYLEDVGLPLVAIVVVAVVGRQLIPTDASQLVTLGMLALVSSVTLITAVLITPATRHWTLQAAMRFLGKQRALTVAEATGVSAAIEPQAVIGPTRAETGFQDRQE